MQQNVSKYLQNTHTHTHAADVQSSTSLLHHIMSQRVAKSLWLIWLIFISLPFISVKERFLPLATLLFVCIRVCVCVFEPQKEQEMMIIV